MVVGSRAAGVGADASGAGAGAGAGGGTVGAGAGTGVVGGAVAVPPGGWPVLPPELPGPGREGPGGVLVVLVHAHTAASEETSTTRRSVRIVNSFRMANSYLVSEFSRILPRSGRFENRDVTGNRA